MKKVNINLFRELGDYVGGVSWELNIKSVSEAINAINTLTDGKFNQFFFKNDKLKNKYRILINGKDFFSPEKELNEDNFYLVNESELVMKRSGLESIDIVPFIEESDSKIFGIITLVLGVVLIGVGIGAAIAGGALLALSPSSLILAGLGLAMAGTMALLARPPEFNTGRGPKAGGSSYLYNGPLNTIGEGGPVPVGYGTVLVGSQVISESYQISDYQTFRTTNN